jgi:hypothetical protein
MEYKGYTVFEESVYPKGSRWMCYKTSEGENHDCDYIGEERVYRGNCRWADSLDECKEMIDDLTIEEKFDSCLKIADETLKKSTNF